MVEKLIQQEQNKNSTPGGMKFTKFLIPWLVLTMPLSSFDISPFFAYLNRIIFYGAGVFLACYYLKTKSLSVKTCCWLLFAIISCVWGLRNLGLIKDYVEYCADVVMLISGILILGSGSQAVTEKTGEVIAWGLVFYSLDVIWQSLSGLNIIGLEPYGGVRNWVFFISGAPTFGVFAACLFFCPFYYLPGSRAFFAYSIITPAIFLSNDRAAVIQLLACVLVSLLFVRRKFFMGLVVIALVLISVLLYYYNLVPYRINMLFEFVLWAILNPSEAFSLPANEAVRYSIHGYIATWGPIIKHWFSFDNLNNLIFGSGWGVGPSTLSAVTGIDRPHSLLLELAINFGVLVFLLCWFFYKTANKYNRYSLLIMPFCMPFFFFSIYSFNIFILLVAAWAMMQERASSEQVCLNTPVPS